MSVNSLGASPTDTLGSLVAQALQTIGEDRNRLTTGLYIPKQPDEALGRLEQAFKLCEQAEAVISKVRQASRAGQLPQGKVETLIEAALETGIILEAEADLVRLAQSAQLDAIQVDAFTVQEYQHTRRIVDQLRFRDRTQAIL